MAYEDDRPLSLRMPSYFGGHLLNIPFYFMCASYSVTVCIIFSKAPALSRT